MNKTSWIIFTVFTVGILGLLVVLSGGNKIDVSKVNINTVQTANNQDGNIADHVFGKAGSKVTLIEYGDFQCSACFTAHPIIESITEKYKNQLQFVFRNFPLTTIHANAKAAAAVVEAAGLQGKYWEMNNKVYDAQADWENLNGADRDKFFEGFAHDLGLNITKFKADLITSAVSDKIDYDFAEGKKANVDGTPTFYLNGVKLDSTYNANKAKLTDVINAELKKNGIAIPQ